MKRIITVISVVTASMLFSAIAIFGAENYPMSYGKYGSQQSLTVRMNVCLLPKTVQLNPVLCSKG